MKLKSLFQCRTVSLFHYFIDSLTPINNSSDYDHFK